MRWRCLPVKCSAAIKAGEELGFELNPCNDVVCGGVCLCSVLWQVVVMWEL